MTIFSVTSVWYFPGIELIFDNAGCIDVVQYLCLPFIHAAQEIIILLPCNQIQ